MESGHDNTQTSDQPEIPPMEVQETDSVERMEILGSWVGETTVETENMTIREEGCRDTFTDCEGNKTIHDIRNTLEMIHDGGFQGDLRDISQGITQEQVPAWNFPMSLEDGIISSRKRVKRNGDFLQNPCHLNSCVPDWTGPVSVMVHG